MSIKNISKHKYLLLAVSYTLWLTAISLTSLDSLDLPSVDFADKVVHFFMYFFLTFFWLLAIPRLNNYLFLLLIIVVAWGGLIEFLQEFFIPTRSGSVLDAVANTFGGLFAILFYRYFFQGKNVMM
jgi:VanZ family protein